MPKRKDDGESREPIFPNKELELDMFEDWNEEIEDLKDILPDLNLPERDLHGS